MPDTQAEAISDNTEVTDRIVTDREVCAITTLSRSTLWRLTKMGVLPPKIRLSANRSGRRLSHVLRFLEEREQAS